MPVLDYIPATVSMPVPILIMDGDGLAVRSENRHPWQSSVDADDLAAALAICPHLPELSYDKGWPVLNGVYLAPECPGWPALLALAPIKAAVALGTWTGDTLCIVLRDGQSITVGLDQASGSTRLVVRDSALVVVREVVVVGVVPVALLHVFVR